MFPNLRLTVVAILAAITGIGCGLGLFATFRVNHEPLARLAEGSAPLQLAFDHLGLRSQPQMPLEVRLPIDGAAKVISVPVNETPSANNPSADDVGAGAAVSADLGSVQPAAGGSPDIDPSRAASVPAVLPADQSLAMHDDKAAAPNQPEAVAVAGEQQVSALASAPAASSPAASDAQQIAALNAAAPDEQPSAPPSAPLASDQAKASAEQTAVANPAAAAEQPAAPNAVAASPSAPSGAEQTAAIDAAAATGHKTADEPAAEPAKSLQKKTAKPKAARAAPARRVARIARARRTVPTAASQATAQYPQTTYAQPTYTQSTQTQSTYTQSTSAQQTYSWANGAGQAAVQRVQIRRHHTAKKAAPAAQSNPLPATAGLSGGN